MDRELNISRDEFRLIHEHWDREISRAIGMDTSSIRIICPFIKFDVIDGLLRTTNPARLQVITRLDCRAFYQRVSDISALRLLMRRGASIRSLEGVHSKVYLIGNRHSIVTSANLTTSGLTENSKFGFVSESAHVASECHAYFDLLWSRAGDDITQHALDDCQTVVEQYVAAHGPPPPRHDLPDKSTRFQAARGSSGSDPRMMPVQAFVKFWGNSRKGGRFSPQTTVLDDVAHAGSHTLATYPRPPLQVEDGAVMFMGRLVDGKPNDIIVQGRAIASKHDREKDIASEKDLINRPWRQKYKYLIRLRDAEFVAGVVANGVSLNEMMKDLKHLSFKTTKANAANGRPGINPRTAYQQQPHVQLSAEGFEWLSRRLDNAFAEHGKLSSADLLKIDHSYPFPHYLNRWKE